MVERQTKTITAITRLERAITRHDERRNWLHDGQLSDKWLDSVPRNDDDGHENGSHPGRQPGR